MNVCDIFDTRTDAFCSGVDFQSNHGHPNPAACKRAVVRRPLLAFAINGSEKELQRALQSEEHAECEIDQRYWSLLRKELEKLRLAR